jgi:hypothetical protein
MTHRDAYMSDVTVVLDKRWENDLPAAIKKLEEAGLSVREADDNNGVVEGVIEHRKVHDLEKLDCVDYVRTTFSWIADYPKGDPRDLDKVDQETYE